MSHFRRLLYHLQTASTAAIHWLTTTDAGNAVGLMLALVFALLGIMSLRAFAPR